MDDIVPELYKKIKKPLSAVVGEIIGTGLIGGVVAYPVAAFLMGKQAALFAYVIPFTLSCSAGAVIAYMFVKLPIIGKTLASHSR